MAKPASFVWSLGQTFGYLGQIAVPEGHSSRDRADHRGHHYLVVTNDSVNWAYRIVPAMSLGRREGNSTYYSATHPRTLVAEGASVLQMDLPINRLQANQRLPIEWAKRQAKRDIDAGAPLDVTHTTPAAKLLDVTSYPSIFAGDVVTYTGSVPNSAHTLEALHRAVLRAQEVALNVWGFTCARLEVQFFSSGTAMGLAYNPGSGKQTGKRLISLNYKLLQAYTIDTVWRTIIHELCHHARDEQFRQSNDAHDSQFCEMLGRADPLARDRRGCTFFTEMEDASLAAGIKQRKAGSVPPVYDPALGTVYLGRLKSGKFRIGWVATEKALAKWKTVLTPLNEKAMEDLFKHFTPAQWDDVRVTTENWPYRVAPESLAELIKILVATWPRQMTSIIDYLNTLAAA